MRSYVALFAEDQGLTRGGVLFRPFIYVILLLLCISALLFQRRRTSSPALSSMVMWFMIAALVYELTYFPLAIGTAYRFSYPVVVVAVVGRGLDNGRDRSGSGEHAAVPSLAPAGTTGGGDARHGRCSVVEHDDIAGSIAPRRCNPGRTAKQQLANRRALAGGR